MIANFQELIERARQLGPARIAVVEAHDPDVLESLGEAQPMGLATPVLVGNPTKIEAAAQKVGYKLDPATIVATSTEEASVRQAVDLIREGRADLLMKGKVTTATLIRGIVDRERGLRTGSQLSQVIVFQVPHLDRLMLMTDAAINIAPTLAQKADITRNAIMVAQALGRPKPNVALLTALEFVNPDMPATVDAAALVGMNRRGQITGAFLEGPIALDVPMSRFAAERKNIESPIVEDTDVFICPNIEAANIMFRAMLYFGQGKSGGIVVGAKVPLVLLSRAESAETKIQSIAIARVVQQFQRESAGKA